ncbi:serine/threonine-protein kinase [Streptomyces sp. NPDC048002]|uniref:serine/threonine-protein kinase n=1 Tax=Streptomyces sp. NPDC048002 TaxID=3154344 RepID=UPI0033C2C0D7
MATHGDQGDGSNVRIIGGRYRLEDRIGRGGMGVVWRATDQLLGRRVAVKELPFDESDSGSLSPADLRLRRERTLREARAVALLRHPHVIVVHDVVEHAERPYIVMELIDGGSLADLIHAQGPVDPAEAARIGADLLSALRTAHAAGVLHRDIKPANVLVDAGTGRVVLTDFGIAQVAGASTLTEAGTFVGSPEYTAPERMSGAGAGPAADLWSVGALLCTAVSGESPFRRDTLGGILYAVVSDEIRPPPQAAPLLPVVRGLLERDPLRRLEAGRAEWMLRDFLATGHTPVPPVPPVPSVPSVWRSPRGVLVSVLLVVAVAVAGVSAVAMLMNGKGEGNVPSPSGPGSPTTGPGSSGSGPGSPTTGPSSSGSGPGSSGSGPGSPGSSPAPEASASPTQPPSSPAAVPTTPMPRTYINGR